VNVTVPARFPPADAVIVAESFGYHRCAVVILEGTVLTTTSSLESAHAALCVVPFVFGLLPLYTATQWYVPGSVGTNCGAGELYTPFPLTGTVGDVYASDVQLFGPYSLNVIVPPAGAPAVLLRLIGGLVGCVAVSPRVAESETALPRKTSVLAVVARLGVTGVTVKHSPVDESLDPGIAFAASPVNTARQQYLPTDVT
jgi:hypothetical protein